MTQRMTDEEKKAKAEAKVKAKADQKAAKKAAKEANAKAKAEAKEAKVKEAETQPKPMKKPAIFRYKGKNAGRFVGKEFHPHPEFGTVMVPAAEGEKRLEVAKGGTIEVTDPETIKRLETNPKWERVK